MLARPLPREHQYGTCFAAPSITLGPMASQTWRDDPKLLGVKLARYKFVAKMLEGKINVAELGCADGFGSQVVRQAVGRVSLYDFDPVWRDAAIATGSPFRVHDITLHRLPSRHDAIYMLDTLEHIDPKDETRALYNICASLTPDGVFIAGIPSLESQAYASEISKVGHVNCKTGTKFKRDLERYFRNVFLFGMNDEVVHTGFAPMCHYLLALCVAPNASIPSGDAESVMAGVD